MITTLTVVTIALYVGIGATRWQAMVRFDRAAGIYDPLDHQIANGDRRAIFAKWCFIAAWPAFAVLAIVARRRAAAL